MTVPLIEAEIYEGSTVGFRVSFVDDTGAPVTPSVATWTLTDKQDHVVNARSAVNITPLGTSVVIVLFGDDLAIGAEGITGKQRQLLVQATYDSSLGNDRPWNQAINFNITDLVAV